MVAAYSALVLVVLVLGDPGCRAVGAECFRSMDRYYGSNVALGILEYGRLVSIERANIPFTGNPPVFPLIMAALFQVFGTQTVLPLVLLQSMLVVATGLMLRRLADTVAPCTGDVAMGLLLFNPSVVAHSLLVQTETMHMAAVTAGVALTLLAARSERFLIAAAAGAALGVSALVRPASQALILLLPFVLPLLVVVMAGRQRWKPAVLSGVVGLVAGLVVVAPWALHQHSAGEGWRLSSVGIEDLLLVDSLMYLDPDAPGTVTGHWKQDFLDARDARMRELRPDWNTLTQVQQAQAQREYTLEHYAAMDIAPAVLGTALAVSWTRVLLAGGEGALHELLGLDGGASEQPLAFYGVKAIAIAFAVAARVLGLIGLYWLIRRRQWDIVVLCLGLILLLTVSTFLIGQPRYRMPFEPALMLFAAVGLVQVRDTWKSFHARRVVA